MRDASSETSRPGSLVGDPNYRLYWAGVVIAQMGSAGALATNLWQMQELTGSTLLVGVVSLVEGVGALGLAPFAGGVADRFDRRRLVQLCQSAGLVLALTLAILTHIGAIAPMHIYIAVLLRGAIQTFDGPSRQALIPALVGRARVAEALSLAIPGGSLARLAGPSIAGVLIGVLGTQAAYAFNVLTCATLVIVFALLHFSGPVKAERTATSLLSSIADGFRYVRSRALIWQLMVMDLGPNLLVGYRVLLPSLARDVYEVGAVGYGLLSAAPSVGGILGSAVIYRLRYVRAKGRLVIGFVAAYAGCGIALGLVTGLVPAVVVVTLLGLTDTAAQVLRHAASLTEVPDELRGRVWSLMQMAIRGGPSAGEALLGASALALGAPLALVVGGVATLIWIGALGSVATTLRRYES